MRLGKTLTPTRCSTILALRLFDWAKSLSIRQIVNAIQVLKSTVHDVCKHAIDHVKKEKSNIVAGNGSTTNDLSVDTDSALNGLYITLPSPVPSLALSTTQNLPPRNSRTLSSMLLKNPITMLSILPRNPSTV